MQMARKQASASGHNSLCRRAHSESAAEVGEKPSYSRNVVASSAGFAAVVAMSAMLKRRPRYAVAPSSEAD